MAINLTGSTIASTYGQLLHVDAGPTAVEKTVYSGTGVATALKVGTISASVGNIQLAGNTIQATTGDLTLGSNIAFNNASNARTALGLGSIATQNATNVSITGGSVTGVTLIESNSASVGNIQLTGNIIQATTGDLTLGSNISFANASNARTALGLGSIATQDAGNINVTGGSVVGATLVESDTLATSGVAAHVNLNGNTLSADGTNTNIDVNIAPKGTGEVNVTNINVLSGKVPFDVVTNRAYAAFYDAGTTDQTGNLTDRTAVKWATASVVGAGVTVENDSRITFAESGTYRINANVQLANAENAYHQVLFWFAKNGTNISNSASRTVVPASSNGGASVFVTEIMETVAVGDYIEMYWLPTDLDVTLHYTASVAENPGVTPAIPAIPPARVVVERIA